MDVFMCCWLDDIWCNWMEFVNLGKEINFIYYDWGYNFLLSFFGSIGYFFFDDLGWSYYSDFYVMGILEVVWLQCQKMVIGVVISEYFIISDIKIVIWDVKLNVVIVEVLVQFNGWFQYVLLDFVVQVKFEVNCLGIFFKFVVVELFVGKEVVWLNDMMDVVIFKVMVQEGKVVFIEVYFFINGV